MITNALTGDGIAAEGSFKHMQGVVTEALGSRSIGLIIAVLTGMLLVVWLIRLGVLIMACQRHRHRVCHRP